MKLSDLTWPDVETLNRDLVVLSPIAALEQHSRHLPFFTDSILCEAVVTRVESLLPNEVLLLPLQWLGASAHHLGMAGTLTLEHETYLKVLCETLRSPLRQGFRRVFIMNGHGGNTDGWHLALRQLALEFPQALLCGASYWDPAEAQIAGLLEGSRKNVGHACEFETSLMLYLRPELVRRSEIADDDLRYAPPELHGVYVPLDMKRQTRQGGVGQPSLASAEKGKALFEVLVSRVVEVIRQVRTMALP